MNKSEHIGISIVLIIIIYLINSSLVTRSIIMLIIGTIIPDFIEPANNYNHRKYFHSYGFLKIISIITIISFGLCFINFNIFSWIFYLGLGYILHLLADATTPMGLPN